MQKQSFLFLLLLLAASLLLAYHSFYEIPAYVLIIRFLGIFAFLLLSVTLIISPLISINPAVFAPLLEPRRAIGIAAFIFALLHGILVLLFYFDTKPAGLFSQPALFIGAFALLILFILAISSSDWAIRTLGANNWKIIHKFNYLVFVLAFLHFLFKSNGLFGAKSLNLAEVFLFTFAIAVILLRLVAFLKKKKSM